MGGKKGTAFVVFFCMLLSVLMPQMAVDAEAAQGKEIVIDVTEYGVSPGGMRDNAPAIQKAIAAAKAASETAEGQVVLDFPFGEYQIYPDKASVRELYIANTAGSDSRYKMKTVGFLLEDMENVTIRGNGSLFMFHGKMTTFAAIRCRNIRFEDFAFDFYVPTVVDVTVESMSGNSITVHIPECYDYEVKQGKSITWKSDVSPYTGKPYWTEEGSISSYRQVYYTTEGRVAQDANRLLNNVVSIRELGNRRLQFNYRDGGKSPTIKPGNCYQMRRTVRDHAGMFLWKSEDIVLENLDVHFMHGAGIVGQHSKNLTFANIDFEPPEGSGRATAGYTDFIRLAGCGGKVQITGCMFSNACDPAVDIHGIYNLVTERISDRQYKVKFTDLQHQTEGFPNFFKGDKVKFVSRETMKAASSEAIVEEVSGPAGEGGVLASGSGSLNEIIITLNQDIPLKDGEEYVVENLTYMPEVEITGNLFKECPSEGIRVGTGKNVLIQDNVFDGMGKASVCISSDTVEKFEAGQARDVTVANNIFRRPGSGEAAVLVEPLMLASIVEEPVYENIRIRENTFYMENSYVLSARSVKGLSFTDNEIYRYAPDVTVSLQTPETLRVNGKSRLTAGLAGKVSSSELYTFDGCREVMLSGNSYDAGLKLGGSTSNMNAGTDISQGEGENLDFRGNAAALPAVGTIAYEVRNEDVVSVNYAGEITGLRPGTAKVRACTMAGGKKYVSEWQTVTVEEPGEAALSIRCGDADETVSEHGRTLHYIAEQNPAGSSEVTWKVVDAADGRSETTHAVIDAVTGELTTQSDGVVEVVAKAGALEARKLLVIRKGNWIENKTYMENVRRRPNEWHVLADGGIKINAQNGGIYNQNKFNYVDNLYLSHKEIFGSLENVTAVVKMKGKTKINGDEAGLVFYKDNGNFTILGRRNREGDPFLQMVSETDDVAAEENEPYADIDEESAVWLKLVKSGDTISGFYKTEGNENTEGWIDEGWTSAGSYENAGLGSDFRIGIMACCSVSARGTAFEFYDLQVGTEGSELKNGLLTYHNTAPVMAEGTCSYGAGALSVSPGEFSDADGDEPGIPIVRWEAADSQADAYELSDATGTENVNALDFAGKWVRAVVIPRDSKGLYGAPVRTQPQRVGTEAAVLPQAVSIAGDSIINVHGETKQYRAVLTPGGVNPWVSWRVVDADTQAGTACASIDSAGRLTANADGAVELVARTANGLEARKLIIINKGGKVPVMDILNSDRENWSVTGETQDRIEIKAQPSGLFKEQEPKNLFLYTLGESMEKVEATVKMHGKTTGRWQEAGLIFFQGEDDYFSVGRKHANSDPDGKIKVTVEDARDSDDWVYEGEGEDAPPETDIWLKLVKEGNTLDGLRAYYKTSEDGEWKERKYVGGSTTTWQEDLKAKRPNIRMPLTDSFQIGFVTGGDSGVTWRDSFVFSDFRVRINDGAEQQIPLTEDNQVPFALGAVCIYDETEGILSAALGGFQDGNYDREGTHLVKWEAADEAEGVYELIPGLSGSRITAPASLSGKWVRAVVVPQDEHGLYGTPVESRALRIDTLPAHGAAEASLRMAVFPEIEGMEEFSRYTKGYIAAVPQEQDAVQAVFETLDEAASMEVFLNGRECAAEGESHEFFMKLSAGRNVVLVRVTAEDGKTQAEYRFVLSRWGDSESVLRGLSLDGRAVPVNPLGFTLDNPYRILLERNQETLEMLMTPKSVKASVSVCVNGKNMEGTEAEVQMLPGMNDIAIRVKPETLAPETCYYIEAYVPSDKNAALEELGFTSGVFLNEVFSAGVLSYTGTANEETVLLTAAAQEDAAQIQLYVGGELLHEMDGELSGEIPLKAGMNRICLKVISPDKSESREYLLDIDGNGETYIDFDEESLSGLGDFRKDFSFVDTPIKLLMEDGTTQFFAKGVGGCAGSVEDPMILIYRIEGMGFTWFSGYLGVDQEARADEASVRYRVYLDGRLIDDGGGEDNVLRADTPAVLLDFDVTGAQELVIEVDGTEDGIENDYVSLGDVKFTRPLPGAKPRHTVTYRTDMEEWGLLKARSGNKLTVNGTIGVDDGESLTLMAGKKPGYEFWRWYDEDGTELSREAEFTISSVTKNSAYTAEYITSLAAARNRLQTALQEAESRKDLDLYTPESVAGYLAVLQDVRRVLESSADEASLRVALARLQSARNLLVRKQESGGTPAVPNPPAPPAPLPVPAVPKKGASFSVKGYRYKVTKSDAKKGTVSLTKAPGTKKIEVPASVKKDGYTFKVTEIAKGACQKSKKLVSVTIGVNVKNIGAKAFYKCTKLKTILFKGKQAPSIGRQAFKGMKAACRIRVPKKMSAKQLKKLKKQLNAGKKAVFNRK